MDCRGLWWTVEDSGELWRTLVNCRGLWWTVEDCGGLLRIVVDS